MTSTPVFRKFHCAPYAGLLALSLAACTTTAPLPEKTPPLTCPPCAQCAICPAPVASQIPAVPLPEPTPQPPVVEPPRGRLERASWVTLPQWGTDNPAAALAAFVQGCQVLKAKPEWTEVCGRASLLPDRAGRAVITEFFQDNFEPYHVVNADDSDTGTVTGYYEPLLRGNRVRTEQFKYPLYGPPQDLVTVDLGEVYPDLKNRRLRGRVVGNKLVPYLDRSDIESGTAPLRGLEIAWVDDPVESFFLQIQGSGQIQLPDGTRMRVGYADQNGHPFKSVAGLLIRRGEIRAERASMQGIKEWAKRHPDRVQRFMNGNPSYVFFKELPSDLSGPIGTLGVPLTAGRSIAVDQRVIPLGVPVYLATTFPASPQPLNRLMVAQDTGGAIFGAVRADFFWGFGDTAGAEAGRMKQTGRMWVLLPRGYDPNAGAAPPAINSPAGAGPTGPAR